MAMIDDDRTDSVTASADIRYVTLTVPVCRLCGNDLGVVRLGYGSAHDGEYMCSACIDRGLKCLEREAEGGADDAGGGKYD